MFHFILKVSADYISNTPNSKPQILNKHFNATFYIYIHVYIQYFKRFESRAVYGRELKQKK